MVLLDGHPATGAARGHGQRHRDTQRSEDKAQRTLSPRPLSGTSRAMDAPVIFDRNARRLRRDRAAGDFGHHDFIRRAMLEGIEDRLALVNRGFEDILDLGCADASFGPPPGSRVARMDAGHRFATAAQGIQADEDRLPFADRSFDLVISAGNLDQIDDLPGALALIRRVLRPDGLFLAAFVGGGSLPVLRDAFRSAERERPVARLHPQIDVRSAGDLLMRAGFALPVADLETLEVGYRDIFRLLSDLRGMAAGNLLIDRSPLTRVSLANAAHAFAQQADADGRIAERFNLVFMTGWAPDPSQPVPAKRGSATTSLARAIGR